MSGTATRSGTSSATRSTDARNTGVLVGFTAVSSLADGVLKVVLPLLAVRLTRSPLAVTGVALTLTLPWLLVALHVGVLVDRVDRRRLLMLANLLRFAAMAVLALLAWREAVSLPVLYLAGAVLGVGEVVAVTTATAVVPSAITRDGQERANSWITGAETVCSEFSGPFVGGLLVAAGFFTALSASTAAFAVALVLPALIVGVGRRVAPRPAPQPVHRQIAAGLAHLWRHRLLRTMALTLSVLCVCWGAWLALIPLVATEVLQATPSQYGLVLSALGVGGALGAVAATPLNRLVGRRWVMFGDIIGTLAMVAAPLLTTSIVAVGAGAFLGGLGGTLWVVNARTLAQRLVPLDMMGRFAAAWRLFSWGALPVGALAVGLLAEVVGLRLAFLPFVVVTALLMIPFLRVVTPEAVSAAETADAEQAATPVAPAVPD